MKRITALFMVLPLLTFCASAAADGPRGGGRGGGSGNGSMQTLNEGIACMNGDGADQDCEKALRLFTEAWEAGNMKAARYIGMMYEQGLGVEQDYAKAAELFAAVEASENKSATGVVAAGYELGVLYERGLGVEQDLNKAAELYQEAAAYGYPDAVEALARLSE